MLKAQKEEEEILTVTEEGGDEFKLAKITISVSDQADDFRASDKESLSSEEEGKKLKKKRQRLDNTTKEFLEKVFERKSQPNRRERELIAEKYGISLSQIRVWVCIIFYYFQFILSELLTNITSKFTNKRMRKKKPDSSKKESDKTDDT
ncbi:hypothetical protein CTRG_06239 [Candida tropicalis MYA-3404]|uniref:Homeobox domain-containing protein n=1 Tax=Candida tropicalis (strain ATCC MYA-3404 / T1) TaxID=294747 RepID=C5MJJ6_CANTT|nr:hypothetical protein CTRG_06239 [Candida tropicalis MYA-3404]EER30103.1 hypothetical protein CTRG_06239 [Candida tropicalis MYA-3404]KAG4404053.1 hypothetical protein JTP64_001380 [Candida tropicalis]